MSLKNSFDSVTIFQQVVFPLTISALGLYSASLPYLCTQLVVEEEMRILVFVIKPKTIIYWYVILIIDPVVQIPDGWRQSGIVFINVVNPVRLTENRT